MGFKPRPLTGPRVVAFLRAINVGGRRVKNDELRAIFESAGLRGVETFIASGNVLFHPPPLSVADLEAKLEAQLHKRLGYVVDTFVRTTPELQDIAASTPFGVIERSPQGNVLSVAFARDVIGDSAQRNLASLCGPVDALCAVGRESYWLRRRDVGESELASGQLERTLGVPCTARNMNTIDRLLDKLSG